MFGFPGLVVEGLSEIWHLGTSGCQSLSFRIGFGGFKPAGLVSEGCSVLELVRLYRVYTGFQKSFSCRPTRSCTIKAEFGI